MNIRKLGFDIVRGCNLRCVGCPNSTLAPKIAYITSWDFALCLSNVDVEKVRLLRLFNFGEPLLHPNLPEILGVVKDWGVEVGGVEISTNGQCHKFDALKEVFKMGVLDTLVVSCDGNGTPEDYERLRPPGTWAKLFEFLAIVKELRDEHAPDLRLKTRTVCTSTEGQWRWMKLLSPLGWEPIFRYWYPLPGAKLCLGEWPSGVQTGICHYMQSKNLYVSYDGAVVPCCVHPRAFVLGNLKEQKYSEIINGERKRSMLDLMSTNRASMDVCRECGF